MERWERLARRTRLGTQPLWISSLNRVLAYDRCRAADVLPLEIDAHFHAVGNFYKWDAAVHPVLLAVESHGSRDGARTGSFAGNRQCQLFRFGHAPDRKVAINLKSIGTGLLNLCGLET